MARLRFRTLWLVLSSAVVVGTHASRQEDTLVGKPRLGKAQLALHIARQTLDRRVYMSLLRDAACAAAPNDKGMDTGTSLAQRHTAAHQVAGDPSRCEELCPKRESSCTEVCDTVRDMICDRQGFQIITNEETAAKSAMVSAAATRAVQDAVRTVVGESAGLAKEAARQSREAVKLGIAEAGGVLKEGLKETARAAAVAAAGSAAHEAALGAAAAASTAAAAAVAATSGGAGAGAAPAPGGAPAPGPAPAF